jgi:glycine cleavage system pyridoxal-binding protein P
VYVESPGSLTFEVQDIAAIAQEAHRVDAYVIMDNTWASPLYFNPFAHGVDISVQAARPEGKTMEAAPPSSSAMALSKALVVAVPNRP